MILAFLRRGPSVDYYTVIRKKEALVEPLAIYRSGKIEWYLRGTCVREDGPAMLSETGRLEFRPTSLNPWISHAILPDAEMWASSLDAKTMVRADGPVRVTQDGWLIWASPQGGKLSISPMGLIERVSLAGLSSVVPTE